MVCLTTNIKLEETWRRVTLFYTGRFVFSLIKSEEYCYIILRLKNFCIKQSHRLRERFYGRPKISISQVFVLKPNTIHLPIVKRYKGSLFVICPFSGRYTRTWELSVFLLLIIRRKSPEGTSFLNPFRLSLCLLILRNYLLQSLEVLYVYTKQLKVLPQLTLRH